MFSPSTGIESRNLLNTSDPVRWLHFFQVTHKLDVQSFSPAVIEPLKLPDTSDLVCVVTIIINQRPCSVTSLDTRLSRAGGAGVLEAGSTIWTHSLAVWTSDTGFIFCS